MFQHHKDVKDTIQSYEKGESIGSIAKRHNRTNAVICNWISLYSDYKNPYEKDELYQACIQNIENHVIAMRLYKILSCNTKYHTLEDIRQEASADAFLKIRGIGTGLLSEIRKLHGGHLKDKPHTFCEDDELFQKCLKHANYRHHAVRIYNALRRAGIKTTEDLKHLSLEDILNIQGIGTTTAIIVQKIIDEEWGGGKNELS